MKKLSELYTSDGMLHSWGQNHFDSLMKLVEYNGKILSGSVTMRTATSDPLFKLFLWGVVNR